VLQHSLAMRHLSGRQRVRSRLKWQRSLRPGLAAGNCSLGAIPEALETNGVAGADVLNDILLLRHDRPSIDQIQQPPGGDLGSVATPFQDLVLVWPSQQPWATRQSTGMPQRAALGPAVSVKIEPSGERSIEPWHRASPCRNL
jgi:hypothetical protein